MIIIRRKAFNVKQRYLYINLKALVKDTQKNRIFNTKLDRYKMKKKNLNYNVV